MNSLEQFAESIKTNGGGSFNITTGELNPKSGYFVSLKGFEKEGTLSNTYDAAYMYALQNVEELQKEGRFMGAWLEDNKVIFDVSIQIGSEKEAIRIGIENEQRAIYNANTGETIYLKNKE